MVSIHPVLITLVTLFHVSFIRFCYLFIIIANQMMLILTAARTSPDVEHLGFLSRYSTQVGPGRASLSDASGRLPDTRTSKRATASALGFSYTAYSSVFAQDFPIHGNTSQETLPSLGAILSNVVYRVTAAGTGSTDHRARVPAVLAGPSRAKHSGWLPGTRTSKLA